MATKRKVEDEEIRLIRDVPKGEYVRKISQVTLKPQNRVWINNGYDRSACGYELQAADDMNSYIYLRGDFKVLVGFTY